MAQSAKNMNASATTHRTHIVHSAHKLIKEASGGRVVTSDFLSANDGAALAAEVHKLDDVNVSVSSTGGVVGAQRQVVCVFPKHIPQATPALAAVYVAECNDAEALRAALHTVGVEEGALGDILAHDEGVVAIVLRSQLDAALRLEKVERDTVAPVEIALADLTTQSEKTLAVVVPSLRVDVLGAKAFRVSRAYFSKGVANGNVTLNGKPAGKASTAAEGDDVIAEGLGRMRLASVDGTTKKGNYKVTLHIERFGRH